MVLRGSGNGRDKWGKLKGEVWVSTVNIGKQTLFGSDDLNPCR
jgi:hypothetical protein